MNNIRLEIDLLQQPERSITVKSEPVEVIRIISGSITVKPFTPEVAFMLDKMNLDIVPDLCPRYILGDLFHRISAFTDTTVSWHDNGHLDTDLLERKRKRAAHIG